MIPTWLFIVIGALVAFAASSRVVTAAPDVLSPNADEGVDSMPDVGAFNGVRALASAIASAEGFGVPGAIPTRANNPGDLVIPHWYGGTLGAEKISVFPTAEAGWQALYRQLQLIADGRSSVYDATMTLGEMADKYTSTQRSEWAKNVATYLRGHGFPAVTENTTLGEILYG